MVIRALIFMMLALLSASSYAVSCPGFVPPDCSAAAPPLPSGYFHSCSCDGGCYPADYSGWCPTFEDDPNDPNNPAPPDNPLGPGPGGNNPPGANGPGGGGGPLNIGVPAALAIAGGLLAGIGAMVLAPPILVAGATAVALNMGIAAAVGYLLDSAPTAQEAVNGAKAPLQVTLIPSPNVTPPAEGDTAPASIVTNEHGVFRPQGGGVAKGMGEPGWYPTGGGDWVYTPAPTADVPAPSPTATITNGGRSVGQQIVTTPSGGATATIAINRYSDNQITVAYGAKVPATDSKGIQTSVVTTQVVAYDAMGDRQAGESATTIAQNTGSGQSTGSAGNAVSTSSSGGVVGPASGSGTAAGSSGGGGTCGGTGQVPCAVVSGNWNAPSDPNVNAAKSALTAALVDNPFASYLHPTLSVSSGSCPQLLMPFFGHELSTTSHCTIAESVRSEMSAIFLLIWAVSAMFVVLKA